MAETIQFTLNGAPRTVALEGWEKIIDVLRETLNLTGTKRGCDDGTCGACTIVIYGEAKRACLLPAAKLAGAQVTTIEGLSRGLEIHPIQKALIEAGAVQCGYCTPGFLMSAAKLLEEKPHPTKEDIQQSLTGNLCRCTGYYKIIQAVERAAEKGR